MNLDLLVCIKYTWLSQALITEEQKYRSEIAKITGMAFMTPVGRIFLDPFTFVQQYDSQFVINYFLYSLLVGSMGFILMLKAHDILKEKFKS